MVAGKRILVVDDEPTVREACERIFRERGYDVETAANGRDGLARTQAGYFDCALVDLRMPDLDGMEIVRRSRAERGHMAVVVITGYGAVETAAEAARLGVADYVTKPFEPDQIVASVERALTHSPQGGIAVTADRIVEELRQVAPKPEHFEHRSPQALAQMVTTAVGVKKATASLLSILVLGVLAGVYIGFGAAMATLVGTDAAARFGLGVGQLLVGLVFSIGLILVVIAGAELFTGNSLMIASVLNREYGVGRMLGRWGLVFLANFVGSLLLVYIMYETGLWKTASNAVGAKAIAVANAKVNLTFGEAFFRAIGCNWLVCLAVWMALSAREIAGKILAIVFPITAFVALGFEHNVANMYFIPMGLILKGTVAASSFAPDALHALTWPNFLVRNLVPVTLGNIVGGALFVGSLYWLVYMRSVKKT
jgi:formate/nitrite transporter